MVRNLHCTVLTGLAVTLLVAAWAWPAAAGAASTLAGNLPRRAALGFSISDADNRLSVRDLEDGSPAFLAGLRDGDVIAEIDGQGFAKSYVGESLLARSKGRRRLALTIEREGRRSTVAFTPEALPLESVDGLDSYYDVVDMPDGARLRTIITRPAGSQGPLPALFFVQWVSCDSIEFLDAGPWVDVYRHLAQRSGMAMIRVERAPSGDSEGPPCHEFDLDTEVAHYRHAFDRLMGSPHIDPRRVVVLGNSLGSMVAPLVAVGKPVAGVTVASGGALTYFERMVYFGRQALERGGGDPAEIHSRLLEQIRFHVAYLLDGKTPEQIAAEDPSLGAVWRRIPATGDGRHYGRPYAYHHQAARQDLLAAWARIEAPILVLFNGFDQYESRRGAEVIVEVGNRLRPGSARFVELPMLDHSFFLAPSADIAYRRVPGRLTPAPEPAVAAILDWLATDVGIASARGAR